jgi:hypothetical protein
MRLALRCMRNCTSVTGRSQFSVENANTVSQRMPSSIAASTVSCSAVSPAACPSIRLRP